MIYVLQGWLNDRENKDTYTYYTEYLKIKIRINVLMEG